MPIVSSPRGRNLGYNPMTPRYLIDTELMASPLSKHRRAERRRRTWVKARNAQKVHLGIVHPDGVLDCICERSVWYFAKQKSVGHRHHCEFCHPRYRNGSTRVRLKRFMAASGLIPRNRALKTVFYN